MTINNNNIFGAFTLNEARGSRLTGDWLHTDTIANYGWFGGGATPASVATVDRIDFSNDSITALARGSLSSTRQGLAATGNSNYGWFGGGFPLVATVDRIDFSNDSATALARGPLSLARWKLAATGNSNYGWFGGGYTPSPFTSFSTVDRIDFSNDAATALAKGPLSSGRYSLAATGNSNYGWFAVSPGGISTVDRIDFSNDASIASVRGPLSLSRGALTATGNSNYGWFGGGDTPSGPGPIEYTVVQRIDFSNDLSTASIRGPLTSPGRSNLAATGNSNYGWFGGGLFSIPGPPFTTTTRVTSVDRIDFSNDSVTASPRGSLTSPGRSNLAATSGVLNIRRQKAGNYGWWGGGNSPSITSTVDRIDFSNDLSTASPRGPLSYSPGVYRLASTGNSNYGWFGAGELQSGNTSKVDRIDFSNDSVTASPRGLLSNARKLLSSTGNSNYGWFGGGYILYDLQESKVERIDFSNDLATASQRSPLSTTRFELASTGNSNYGWFGGGRGGSPIATRAIVDRIDFSNDNTTISPRGPLSSGRQVLAATGNSNYGWFGGGFNASFTPQATVDRIDFSNDLATASVRGSLSSAKFGAAATGNSNYGWFGQFASVDRIDFSNDLATASVRGPLSGAFYRGATSNTPIG